MTWNDLRVILLTLGVVVALYALSLWPSDLLGLQAIDFADRDASYTSPSLSLKQPKVLNQQKQKEDDRDRRQNPH